MSSIGDSRHVAPETSDGPVHSYDDCFVMGFDRDCSCTDFTEWYVTRLGPKHSSS